MSLGFHSRRWQVHVFPYNLHHPIIPGARDRNTQRKCVYRAAKEGLPGAHIVVKGTSIGTSSDLAGGTPSEVCQPGHRQLWFHISVSIAEHFGRYPEGSTQTKDFLLVLPRSREKSIGHRTSSGSVAGVKPTVGFRQNCQLCF